MYSPSAAAEDELAEAMFWWESSQVNHQLASGTHSILGFPTITRKRRKFFRNSDLCLICTIRITENQTQHYRRYYRRYTCTGLALNGFESSALRWLDSKVVRNVRPNTSLRSFGHWSSDTCRVSDERIYAARFHTNVERSKSADARTGDVAPLLTCSCSQFSAWLAASLPPPV
jgi:hypothetical protein